jgi:hypothetical protein
MRDVVMTAAASGLHYTQIALVIGISERSLRTHFTRELHRGVAVKRIELAQAIFASAKRGSVTAARLYLRRKPAVIAANGNVRRRG